MQSLTMLHEENDESGSTSSFQLSNSFKCNSVLGDETQKFTKKQWQNVFLRIKPTSSEKFCEEDCPFTVLDSQTLLVKTTTQTSLSKTPKASGKPIAHKYTFTKIFNQDVGQHEFFKDACLPLLNDFIRGDNCLLFAYGASNAGKTHTIQGNVQEPGVIPQSINVLFSSLQGHLSPICRYKPEMGGAVVLLDENCLEDELRHKKAILNFPLDSFNGSSVFSSKSTQMSEDSLDSRSNYSTIFSSSNVTQGFISAMFQDMQNSLNDTVIDVQDQGNIVFSVFVSFAEIYNESIYDLLELPSQSKRRQLTLGENTQKDVYIKGLRHICVSSGDEAYHIFLYGRHNLQLAPTNLNHASSRSHGIFSITLIRHVNTECPSYARVNMFSIVDLAGAERAKKTQNVGDRMKESQNINTSLLVLGRCLEVIRHNQSLKDKKMIPFRDSKLSRLFQRALTGKDMITMIINMNPDSITYDETVNVLKFSAVARQIVFEAVKPLNRRSHSSRFSKYALQSFRSSRQKNRSQESGLSTSCQSINSTEETKELLSLVDKLNEELKEQRLINSTLESELRQEMYEKFSRMLIEVESSWQDRLRDSEDRLEDLSEWRIRQLQDYYESQNKRKRSRPHSNDIEDLKLKDAEEEITYLKRKVSNSEALLKLTYESSKDISISSAHLRSQLASTQQELTCASKLLEVSSSHLAKDPLLEELRKQLQDNQQLLRKKECEIQDLEGLRDEAQEEFIKFLQIEEENENHIECLEKLVASKDEEIEDLKTKLDKCHATISQHVVACQQKSDEEANDILIHQQLLEDRDEYKFKAFNYETLIKKLQNEIEELKCKVVTQQSKPVDKNVRALEMQVLSLEDELSVSKNKCKESESRIQALEEEMLASSNQQVALEREVSVLQKEVKYLLKRNTMLKEECSNTKKECASNEKALKDNVKILNMAEKCLQEEQKKTRHIEMSQNSELQQLKLQLQTYEANKDLMSTFTGEMQRKMQDFKELERQNIMLQEQLKYQEEDMDSFKNRQEHQFKLYDDMLRQEREEVERQKREVFRLQEVFVKSPTPKKLEYTAEINQLKNDLSSATSELEKYRRLVMNCQFQSKVGTSPLVLKREKVSVRKTRSRTTQDENLDPSHESLAKAMPAPERNQDKGRSRRKKLLNVYDATKESVELQKETARDISLEMDKNMKRNLRKRQT